MFRQKAGIKYIVAVTLFITVKWCVRPHCPPLLPEPLLHSPAWRPPPVLQHCREWSAVGGLRCSQRVSWWRGSSVGVVCSGTYSRSCPAVHLGRSPRAIFCGTPAGSDVIVFLISVHPTFWVRTAADQPSFNVMLMLNFKWVKTVFLLKVKFRAWLLTKISSN